MQIEQVNTERFNRFLAALDEIVGHAGDNEQQILKKGGDRLGELVSHDDWLPEFCAEPHSEHYQQYLLYCDPQERYSVVSFVWGPGQRTPVHNHTVWGLIGMLRGSEKAISYDCDTDGSLRAGGEEQLQPGDVDRVSPNIGDIHKVSNAFDDKVSISIHVYGANIGKVRRHVFDEVDSQPKEFISGYANNVLPNFWRG